MNIDETTGLVGEEIEDSEDEEIRIVSELGEFHIEKSPSGKLQIWKDPKDLNKKKFPKLTRE